MAVGSVASAVVGGFKAAGKGIGRGARAVGRAFTGEPGRFGGGGIGRRGGGGGIGRRSGGRTRGRGRVGSPTILGGQDKAQQERFARLSDPFDPNSDVRRVVSQGPGRLPLSSHVVFQEGRAGPVTQIRRGDPRSVALGNPQIDFDLVPQGVVGHKRQVRTDPSVRTRGRAPFAGNRRGRIGRRGGGRGIA